VGVEPGAGEEDGDLAERQRGDACSRICSGPAMSNPSQTPPLNFARDCLLTACTPPCACHRRPSRARRLWCSPRCMLVGGGGPVLGTEALSSHSAAAAGARYGSPHGALAASRLLELDGGGLRGALLASRLLELDSGAALPAVCPAAAADRRQGWPPSPCARRRRPARSSLCVAPPPCIRPRRGSPVGNLREREKNE
jgi:hypothetical protein